jgi:hypothetical protein
MFDNKFIKEVKTILYMITSYGIDRTKTEKIFLKGEVIRDFDHFITQVHIGFMMAQKNILFNLQKLSKDKKNIKEKIKASNMDIDNRNKLKEQVKLLELKENIMKKLADSIAWKLLDYDYTSIRRLYHDQNQMDIGNSNILHDITTINAIFEENKRKFPLITDITSFMQTGDILLKDTSKGNGSISIIELKEGKVNEKIEEILMNYTNNHCDYYLHNELKSKDEKFAKQFSRYIKQQKSMINVINTINSGEGIDQSTGLNVKISKDIFTVNSYEKDILDMLEEVNKKNYSTRVIDDCLLIGVYNNTKLNMQFAFKGWVDILKIDFPIINLFSSINIPLAYPLFIHSFSLEDKIKLIDGKKTVLMCLDINMWLEKMREKGISYRYLTTKETGRINSVNKNIKAFVLNDKAIEFDYKGNKTLLYDGLFGRMFYELINPSSIIDFLKHNLLHFNDEEVLQS